MAEYRIVAGASELTISAKSSVHGIGGFATQISGSVDVDLVDGRPKALHSGRLEVPIEGLRSGNALYDAELGRRVDARRFPVIIGEIRSVSAVNDDGLFDVEGDLTFHGVTRPVADTLTVHLDDGRLVLEGQHTFDIRDFDVKPPRILMLRVHPDVTVRIRLVAEPADR